MDESRLPEFDTLDRFAINLRRKCKFRTLTEAANYCSISHSAVSRYESGQHVPEPRYLACLACYYIETEADPRWVAQH